MTQYSDAKKLFFEVCKACAYRVLRNGSPTLQTRQPYLSVDEYSQAIAMRAEGVSWRKVALAFSKDHGNMRRLVTREIAQREGL